MILLLERQRSTALGSTAAGWPDLTSTRASRPVLDGVLAERREHVDLYAVPAAVWRRGVRSVGVPAQEAAHAEDEVVRAGLQVELRVAHARARRAVVWRCCNAMGSTSSKPIPPADPSTGRCSTVGCSAGCRTCHTSPWTRRLSQPQRHRPERTAPRLRLRATRKEARRPSVLCDVAIRGRPSLRSLDAFEAR